MSNIKYDAVKALNKAVKSNDKRVEFLTELNDQLNRLNEYLNSIKFYEETPNDIVGYEPIEPDVLLKVIDESFQFKLPNVVRDAGYVFLDFKIDDDKIKDISIVDATGSHYDFQDVERTGTPSDFSQFMDPVITYISEKLPAQYHQTIRHGKALKPNG